MNVTAKVKAREPADIRFRTALTPEERENQLCMLAVDLAEQQLRDGTASSQVITHYLKRCTTKEKLECEKLKKENLLLQAKTDAIKAGGEIGALYKEAIAAMRIYQGRETDDNESEEY